MRGHAKSPPSLGEKTLPQGPSQADLQQEGIRLDFSEPCFLSASFPLRNLKTSVWSIEDVCHIFIPKLENFITKYKLASRGIQSLLWETTVHRGYGRSSSL